MNDITLQINLRPHQLAAYQAETRFQTLVWHRRAGKSFFVIAMQLARAFATKKTDYRAYYLAPTRVQAKAIAFDYYKAFTQGVPGVVISEQELSITLPNGAKITLLGAEQYHALRGRYADDITIDETALVPTQAWTMVLSPMLADRNGRATFIGTPLGRLNLFYSVWQQAGGDDPEWSRSLLTYKDTTAIPPNEVERLKRSMRIEEFQQEMECSWNAALRGSYYAREMGDMDAQGRITNVKYDNTLPVSVAVDLGYSDAMVAVFFQQAGTEVRIINCVSYEQTAIPEMVAHWKTLDYPIDHVVLPHDAKVTELGTGKTRQQTFHDLGCNTSICPNLRVHEGIEQVRQLLPHVWMDRENCQNLQEALVAYRSEYDEVRGVHRMSPLHDYSSHFADAVRYMAIGKPNLHVNWDSFPRTNSPSNSVRF